MTIAECISKLYRYDGQCFVINGLAIGRVCGALCERHIVSVSRGSVRYVFPDLSVITIASDAWDIGHTGCSCFAGDDHSERCESSGVEA